MLKNRAHFQCGTTLNIDNVNLNERFTSCIELIEGHAKNIQKEALGLAKISNWVNDTNTNNTTLRVYGGDMEGNLWRFDPNTGTAFVLAQFKDGRSAGVAMPQPITTKPELGDAIAGCDYGADEWPTGDARLVALRDGRRE